MNRRSLLAQTHLSEKPVLKNIAFLFGSSNYMGPIGWPNADPRSELIVYCCSPPVWLRREDTITH